MLNGFVDSLLQSFENHRAGLTEDMLRAGDQEAFFLDLYQKEVPRLREIVRNQELALPDAARDDFFHEVNDYVRHVVVPAYARLAGRFTGRERNDFYLTPESLHGLERLGWGAAGMLLGGLVVWAPFIPIWSKEWVLLFAVGGLVFPNLRGFLVTRRYETDLNRLVAHADDEIWRKDLAYVTESASRRGEALAPDEDEPEPPNRDNVADRLAGEAEAADGAASEPGGAARRKLREGDR